MAAGADQPPGGGNREAPGVTSRLAVVLSRARAIVVVPVVVLALSALGAFAYGTEVFVNSVEVVVRHPVPVGSKIGLFLLVVDLFLIGATLLIAALGFYELFLGRLEDAPGASRTPAWLQMHDLNDLKARVIAMIVLVAAVSFVEVVVDVGPGLEILEVGGGIALVIGALTVFVRFGSTAAREHEANEGSRSPGKPGRA